MCAQVANVGAGFNTKNVNKSNGNNMHRVRQNKYSVFPVDLSDKMTKKNAYDELTVMKEYLTTDYKQWGAEEVDYSNFDPTTGQSLVEARNDVVRSRAASEQYTMSQLGNIVGSFRGSAFTLGAFLRAGATRKYAEVANPNFKGDVSRLYSNFHKNMVSSANSMQGPLGKTVGRQAMFALDNYFLGTSPSFLQQQIDRNLRANSIDTLNITPRQIAFLKVNFMEQYYNDTRNGKAGNLDDYTQAYEKALDHLNAIAVNNGFDMSIVAAEERYIVGLKIKEHSEYAAMFSETTPMYGLHPVDDKDGCFSGKFKTGDNHDFYAGRDNIRHGAFSVRPVSSKDDIAKNLEFYGRSVVAMKVYVNSNMEDFNKSVDKNDLYSRIEGSAEEYKKRMIVCLQDDCGFSKVKAKAYVDNFFNQGYSDFLKNLDKGNELSSGFSYECLGSEMDFILSKAILKNLGCDSSVFECKRTGNLTKDKDTVDRMNENIASFVYDYDSDHISHIRSVEEQIRNYSRSLSTDEIFYALQKAAANADQGRMYGNVPRFSFEKAIQCKDYQPSSSGKSRGDEFDNDGFFETDDEYDGF